MWGVPEWIRIARCTELLRRGSFSLRIDPVDVAIEE
jgi:hypothetical protein